MCICVGAPGGNGCVMEDINTEGSSHYSYVGMEWGFLGSMVICPSQVVIIVV